MDLEHIRAFLATVDEGSLSGAARALHRTQPSVTRLIQALEAELGTPLLDRSSKPARPTPRGLAMVESARKVMEALQELEAVGQARRRTGRLAFRLGVSHALVRLLGEVPLRAWKEGQRRLDLRIETGWSLGLVQMLREGQLEAVLAPFSGAWTPPADLRGRCFGSDDLVLAHPARMKLPTATRLKDLLELPWVLNPDGCGIRAALQRAWAEYGRVLVPALEVTGDFGALLEFVAQGYGVTFAPRWLVESHAQAAALGARTLEGALMRSSFWLVHRAPAPPLAPLLRDLERAVAAALEGRLAG